MTFLALSIGCSRPPPDSTTDATATSQTKTSTPRPSPTTWTSTPPDTGTASTHAPFTPPATCSPVKYAAKNWTNYCGVERRAVKQGDDDDVGKIDWSTIRWTTIGDLGDKQPPDGTIGDWPEYGRVGPVETTLWGLRDVQILEVKLEDDSDYHVVLEDETGTMIAEAPFPACTKSGGRYQCEETHAREEIEAIALPYNGWTHVGRIGSVWGIGFWDADHDQTGVAPNAIEIHALFGLCVGRGCDPTIDPTP